MSQPFLGSPALSVRKLPGNLKSAVENMSRIYTFGEIVYDLIFKGGKPISGTPGGAMLNTSVTLGRLDVPVSFISETGMDQVGNMIISFLQQNHIATDLIYRDNSNKTALALAFLDEHLNASYDFYRYYPSQDFRIPVPSFSKSDYFMFGSLFSLTHRYLPTLKTFKSSARKAGSIIYYDPNFRETHLEELPELKPLIIEHIESSDIIRGSDEDFRHIFGAETPGEAWEVIQHPEKVLIYTASQNGVFLFTEKYQKQYPVKSIKPVSTIGAGDNFNAGIIYSLIKNSIYHDTLSRLEKDLWDMIIRTGIGFGTMACLTMDNYLTKKELKKKSKLF